MTTTSDVPGRSEPGAAATQSRFERLIDGLVNGIVLPMVTKGVAFAIFAVLWIAFGVAMISSQGGLDAAWQWATSLPILVQAVVWLLFLPVMVGLWVWETSWPLAIRFAAVLALAGWSLLIFLPRKPGTRP